MHNYINSHINYSNQPVTKSTKILILKHSVDRICKINIFPNIKKL